MKGRKLSKINAFSDYANVLLWGEDDGRRNLIFNENRESLKCPIYKEESMHFWKKLCFL